ncbi:hypothetical protein VSH64_31570 [Amycolatopsis rhabdoformis]|uniref:Uncharacterized protein n=1 Tax=Amycolatopsis rhabdoformis TaxID=1448059 RepID=A0ABZ1HZU4_9PSEU|nr:hypothetical protein [Amycolatopsis rhabdoformis]WSE27384.1 hypothetical protein VSH64_31570 [Amycolatopsis rhabdoformis]
MSQSPEVVPRVNGHAVVKHPPLFARIDRVLLVIVALHCVGVGVLVARHPDTAVTLGQAVLVLALSGTGVWRHLRSRGRSGAILLGVSMAVSFISVGWFGPPDVTNGVLFLVQLSGAVFAVAVLRRRVRIA